MRAAADIVEYRHDFEGSKRGRMHKTWGPEKYLPLTKTGHQQSQWHGPRSDSVLYLSKEDGTETPVWRATSITRLMKRSLRVLRMQSMHLWRNESGWNKSFWSFLEFVAGLFSQPTCVRCCLRSPNHFIRSQLTS